MSKLYELTAEYDRLLESDGEEEQQALVEVCGAIQKKAQDICKFVANLESDADALKAEEQRLAARRKALENKAQSVKDYIKAQMVEHSIMKLDAGLFKLSVSPSSGSVVIDDAEKLPAKFKTIVQEVKVDKGAIKDAIKHGGEVAGARIEEGWKLTIR